MWHMFNFQSQKDRSRMYRAIRDFFDSRDYLEVFTPTLSPTLIPEPTIQNFETRFINEFVASRDFYLIPSPEIFMKEALAGGSGSIYQISQCFRNSEQLGSIHNPEFSMLEYYTVGYDEKDSIGLTQELLKALASDSSPDCFRKDFIIMSVNEAMIMYAHTDLEQYQDRKLLRERAIELGQEPEQDEAWDDIFNRIFITYVEPQLPEDRIVVLTDYPYQIDCLAAKQDGRPYRSRWEMYIMGMEVANCYREETDPGVTETYYEREYARLVAQRSDSGLPIPDISPRFPSLEIPSSSGVAIGLDRLLMCLSGKRDIRKVLLFPFDRLLKE